MIKYRILRIALVAEAILCIVLSALHATLPAHFPALTSFPFSQLGLGLRMLSLSGSFGNFASIILYGVLCLLPACSLLLLRKREQLHWEDSFPVFISAAMFPVMYLMINPGLMTVPNSEGIFCAVLWSLAAAWLTLRLLRSLFSSDRMQLTLWFSRLLCAAAFYYVFEVFGLLLPALLQELSMMQLSLDPFSPFTYSDTEVAFTVLRHLVSALPALASLPVILRAITLMDLVRSEKDGIIPAAEKLSLLCRNALMLSILSIAVLNLLQLFLYEQLMNVHISVVLPVMDLILVLGILLLTRYIAENRKLQEDNDLFI